MKTLAVQGPGPLVLGSAAQGLLGSRGRVVGLAPRHLKLLCDFYVKMWTHTQK